MIWPARALRAQGHDVHVIVPRERGGSVGLNGMVDTRTGKLLDVNVPPDADVVVMQRPTLAGLAQAVPILRAKGVAVVVDMDDDLSRVHPANIAFTAMHPRPGVGRPDHSWHNATLACQHATLVTVSAPALLRAYAPHGRGVVLENCVPASYLDLPHEDSAVIGWGGSTHSHPDDLQTVGLAVSRLVRDGHRFRVVGPPDGVREALHLDGEVEATGPVPIEVWPAALARLGVGIAPLADSRFNLAKSFLKAEEMMACGVPWVASPRPEYWRLHQRTGCGLLADKPRDWYRHLAALATDEARRVDMSQAGRVAAAALTIEANAWKWADAWAQALRLQRQTAASAFSRV